MITFEIITTIILLFVGFFHPKNEPEEVFECIICVILGAGMLIDIILRFNSQKPLPQSLPNQLNNAVNP